MAKVALAAVLYAVALALIWFGVNHAPSHGWPTNDDALNGCAALVLGCMFKIAGHVTLLRAAR